MPVKKNKNNVRQYLRWLPARLGIINKAAFALNIDRIYPDDVFIVSFPKSGNTWVRFLIANMMFPDKQINMSNINQFIPDVYTSKTIINRQTKNRLIKTHHPLFRYYPKFIYVIRDYRDATVSNYHRFVSRKKYAGDFNSFFETALGEEEFGSWKQHVLKAYQEFKTRPESVLIVRYEDLISQPEKEVQRMAEFLELKTIVDLKDVIEKSSFEKLRADEDLHPGIVKPKSADHFFRKGKSGKWKDYFSNFHLESMKKDHELMLAMEKSGYIV